MPLDTIDVSYVVAAFQAEATIRESVESALAQTGVSVEVVVVDDGSTDGTSAVVRAIDDDRVRLVTLPRNGGAAAARNVGIDAAVGRWIGILDSDDILTEDRTARMLALAERQGVGAVVDNIEMWNPTSGSRRIMYDADAFPDRHLDLARYVSGNVMYDRSAAYAYGYLQPLVRRDVITEHTIAYRPELRIGEDFVFFCECLATTGRAAVDLDAGYVYRVRPDSVSHKLRLADVEALSAADRHLRTSLVLSAEEAAALDRRTDSLAEAAAYLRFVDAVRVGAWREALSGAVARPRILTHLSLPVRARLRRLMGRSEER